MPPLTGDTSLSVAIYSRPARQVTADPDFLNRDGALTPGTSVGPYEILGKIGSGGMGQVYRARDTRLNRIVALKALRTDLPSRSALRERFKREAELIASLNHPHICTLYDVISQNESDYLVMEFIDGETLDVRLAHGSLSIEQAVRLGSEIAGALARAHAHGVVHRDLKPANVAITRHGGHAKLLDFGVATLLAPASAGSRHDTRALTQEGDIVGTPRYMAPEQIEGAAVDQRVDIFALGGTLFEMLTGQTAFRGDGIATLIAAVLTHHPPAVSSLRADVPPALDRVVKKCLAKDPSERWQNADDLASELKWIGESVPVTTRPAGARWFRLGLYATAAAAIVSVATAAGYRFRPAAASEPVTRFSVAPPAGNVFANIATGGPPAISPDGRVIAFVAGLAGQPRLWVQPLDSLEARVLPDTEGASTPFWSPDGKSLGFSARGRLKKIDLAGGSSQVIADVVGQIGSVGSWNRDGQIMFSPRGGDLALVSATGGPVTPVTTMDTNLLEENHAWPQFLPDGRRYLYHVRAGTQLELQVYVGELGSSTRTLLLRGVTRAQYAPPRGQWPGYLLYVRDGTLLAQPFDADTVMLTADPVAIANNVATTAVGAGGDFSVALDRSLVYRAGDAAEQELAWFDRLGHSAPAARKRPGRIGAGMRLSPGGNAAAYTWLLGQQPDVWIINFASGIPSRFTFNTGSNPAWSPILSPDGLEVAFLRKDGIYKKHATGTGNETLIWKDDRVLAVNDWSGDGKTLLVTRWDTEAGRGLWLVPVTISDASASPSAARTAVMLHAPALHGQFSPATGAPKFVAYDSNETGVREVFVMAMPGDTPGRWQVSNGGGNAPRWPGNGRELYYLGPGGLMAVRLTLTPSFRAGAPRSLFPAPRGLVAGAAQYAPSYDVAADGSRLLLPAPGTDTPPPALHVILNWQAGLPQIRNGK